MYLIGIGGFFVAISFGFFNKNYCCPIKVGSKHKIWLNRLF